MSSRRDNTRRRRFLTVCADPGGARAILPVARTLAERGGTVRSVVAKEAVTIFPSAPSSDWKVVEVKDGLDARAVSDLIEEFHPDVLLTGAGTYNRIEHTFRILAPHKDLPSITLLDYWNEYAARFRRTEEGSLSYSSPDFVCALDARSREGIHREVGLPEDRIVITGPPNLEESVRRYRSGVRDQARRRINASAPVVFVFFSDPFFVGPEREYVQHEGTMFDDEGRSLFGYTPDSILSRLLGALEMKAGTDDLAADLLIKPHPREHPGPLMEVLNRVETERIDARLVEPSTSSVDLVAASDVVFGMGSVVLLESALAGRPTVSVQIGLEERDIYDPCMGNVLDLTHPVFTQSDLEETVERAFRGSLAVLDGDDTLEIEGATERAAEVAEQVASGGRLGAQTDRPSFARE